MNKIIKKFLLGWLIGSTAALITHVSLNNIEIALKILGLAFALILIFKLIKPIFLGEPIDVLLKEFNGSEPSYSNNISGCSLLIIIFCIIWAVPAIVITYVLNPENKQTAFKITIFIVSLVVSISYFILNREKFKGPGDITSYFCSLLLGPVGVVQIFYN